MEEYLIRSVADEIDLVIGNWLAIHLFVFKLILYCCPGLFGGDSSWSLDMN